MTLDELKTYEAEVANHRALDPEVMTNLFAIARTTLSAQEAPVVVETPAKAPKKATRPNPADGAPNPPNHDPVG